MRTDTEFLEMLREQPEKALGELINCYGGLVYAIVRGKLAGTCQREDMEECVSDIFYEFYSIKGQIDLQKGSLKSFLAVIAKRRAIDAFRKLSSHSSRANALAFADVGPIYNTDDAEISTVSHETRSELITGIKALGEPDSEIFIRRYYFGQSSKEIGKALKLKPNTVDKRISRGLNKLRSILGGSLVWKDK